jgi:pilus assembly protein CpaB
MKYSLLLVAALIAVVAGVVALNLTSDAPVQPVITQAPAQAEPLVTVEIMVAKRPIALGEVISEDMVDKQPWPKNLLLESFVQASDFNSKVLGKVARSEFQVREPLIETKLANPGDPSFLAANLPEGMRAVTIATDAVSGVAGYVFPGDHVDVLLTHNIPKDIKAEKSGAVSVSFKPAITEVVVANARVLGVNVRETAQSKTAPVSAVPNSVTLEISDEYAQRVRLAEKVGTLSLALRSLKDQNKSTSPTPTHVGSLSGERDAGVASGDYVKIIRGTDKVAGNAVGGTGLGLGGGNVEMAPIPGMPPSAMPPTTPMN